MDRKAYLERLMRLGQMPERRLNLADFEPTPRRIIGRWAMLAGEALCPCHLGLYVFSDGAVQLFDLFGRQLQDGSTDCDWWKFEFDFREHLDAGCRGEEADLCCDFARTIRLPRHLVGLMLRLNARGFDSLESAGWIDYSAWVLNNALEEIFWTELVRWLPLAPQRRVSFDSPSLPFPSEKAEVVCHVPGSWERST